MAALRAVAAVAQTTGPASPPVPMAGTPFGTAGSFQNGGNTIAKAFDGNPATFFDSAVANGNVIGLDLGSTRVVGRVAFAPRPGWGGRMVGGVIQAGNDAAFTTGVTTVYTVAAAPASGALTTVTLSTPVAARYWRYVPPRDSYGNIAEFELFVATAAPGPVAQAAAPLAAPLATTQAVAPATGPLTGIVCGCGPTAAATATYHAGQAPCIAWLDARPFTTTRGDRRLWHLPRGSAPVLDPRHVADPVAYPSMTIDPDNSLTGQVVAAEFDAPGTYPVTVDVTHADGTTATYGVTVVVDADARQHYYFGPAGNDANAGTDLGHPWASAAKFAATAALSNAHVTALPGYAASLPPGPVAAVAVGVNTVIDGQRDGSGNRPVLTIGGYPAFYASHGAHDVLIRGLTVTSVGTRRVTAGLTLTAAAAGSGGGRAEFLIDSGTNIVMADCGLGCLTRAAEMDDAAAVADGFGVLGCQQLDPLSIGGQVLYGGVGGKVCWDFNTLTGATAEAVCRFEGVGSGTGASVEGNLLEQSHPAAGDKAVLDARNGNGLVITNNGFINGQLSTSTSIGSTATVAANVLAARNVYRLSAAVPFTGWVQVKPRTVGLTLAGEDFGPSVLDGIDVTATGGVADVAVSGCRYPAGQVPLRVSPGVAVPGLVPDVGQTDGGTGVYAAAATRPAH